jgi:hypothetical protein
VHANDRSSSEVLRPGGLDSGGMGDVGSGQPEPEPADEYAFRDYISPSEARIRIVDGIVLIAFTNPPPPTNAGPNYFDTERQPNDPAYGAPYPPVALDTQIAAFIQAEDLNVLAEWPPVRAMAASLPDDTTVEEAVNSWPVTYAGLVEIVTPDWCVYPDQNPIVNDDAFTTHCHWNLEEAAPRDINVERAWREHLWGSPAACLAVIDTGVQRAHQDISPRVLPYGINISHAIAPGPVEMICAPGGGVPRLSVLNNPALVTMAGHGTCVASIACAANNNDVPGTPFDERDVCGVAPATMFLPVAIELYNDPDVGPNFDEMSTLCAYYSLGMVKRVWRRPQDLDWPYYNIEAVNCSYGGPLQDMGEGWWSLESRFISALSQYMVFACSAGNTRTAVPKDILPAMDPDVLCVGAHDDYTVVPEYNYTDYVDILGPSDSPAPIPGISGVPAADMVGLNVSGIDLGFVTLPWAYINGTSASAPHVAACAVLVSGCHPELTPLQIRQRIIAHALHGDLLGDTLNIGRLDVYASIVGN